MSNTESMGKAPLSHIRDNLNRVFGGKEWVGWELETISLDLGLVFDELTRDKIHLLQILEMDPSLFLTNGLFFLHAVEVMNNNIADFEFVPMPTSLELAYALEEFKKLYPELKIDSSNHTLVGVCSYLMHEDGFSVPLAPFDFIPPELFNQGQEPGDTEAKKRAIELYIKEMGSV